MPRPPSPLHWKSHRHSALPVGSPIHTYIPDTLVGKGWLGKAETLSDRMKRAKKSLNALLLMQQVTQSLALVA